MQKLTDVTGLTDVTQLGVTTSGEDTGLPAVVWIHGYTMDSSTWGPLWDLLPGYRHIGVDLLGHGKSAPMPPDLTLPAMAAQVAQVAQSYGATRVVALSFGASTALQWAIDFPSSVSHLVLGAPNIAGIVSDPITERRYLELAMLKRFGGGAEQLTGLWMSSPPDIFRGTERHPALRRQLRSVIMKHQWTELVSGAMGKLTTSSKQTDDDLATITAKSLAIIGDEEMPAFLSNAKRLNDTIPGCGLKTITGAGHLVLIEEPGLVAPILSEHLGS